MAVIVNQLLGHRALRLLLPVGVWVALAASWQAASSVGYLDSLYFSSPSAVWDELGSLLRGDLLRDVGATLLVLTVGWTSGLVVGAFWGAVLGLSRFWGSVFGPFIAFMNAMPRLLLLPVFVVWFGFGLLPKVLLVFVVIVFVVALNVGAGVREVGDDIMRNMLVMGARRRNLVVDVLVPSMAVWIISTSRSTLGFAFQATVAAEFLGAAEGLGFSLVQGQATFNADRVWAVLVVMLILGAFLDGLLSIAEARFTKWLPR
jgi:ABC-type nitrate/sulfonate/bicarbonate transport system permease component